MAGYAVAMITSYIVGQKFYPLNYPLKEIALYVILTAIAFVAMTLLREKLPMWLSIAINTLLILAFLALIIKRDLPLSKLPIVGKYFKK